MLQQYTEQIETIGLYGFYLLLFLFIGLAIQDVLKKGNVPKGMKEGDPMVFFDTKTKNWVTGFPLPIQDWYVEHEKNRLAPPVEPIGTLEGCV